MTTSILIVGPGWVGDMVMAQTLFKLLKAKQPECHIDVLAPSWGKPLLERMPEVRHVVEMPITHGQLQLRKRFQIAKQLRAENYSQAIVLPNSFKSALIPFWAHIRMRTGWMREMRFGLLNDIRYLNKQKYPLMIQRFAALGLAKNEVLPEVLPWPELNVQAVNVQATLQRLTINKPTHPVLALCPGAEYGPAKRWPEQYFASIANEKLAQGWQVWLLGSQKDQTITQAIQQATSGGCIDLAGKTSLGEAIDLLSLASLVVSNDSGLMHISAALKRPLVVIYGSTDPRFTPPLSEQVKILSLQLACSPCFQRECPLQHLKCLHDLLPERVLAAMSELV